MLFSQQSFINPLHIPETVHKVTKESSTQDWFYCVKFKMYFSALSGLPDTVYFDIKGNVLNWILASNCQPVRERTNPGPTGIDQFFLSQNEQFSADVLYLNV